MTDMNRTLPPDTKALCARGRVRGYGCVLPGGGPVG
jgi:hypothetical protein